MLKKITKWLYSYPDYDKWFGCNIRETVQDIFPCKHDWVESKMGLRCCSKCWKKQRKEYYRFGNVRSQWIDIPFRANKIFRCNGGKI